MIPEDSDYVKGRKLLLDLLVAGIKAVDPFQIVKESLEYQQ